MTMHKNFTNLSLDGYTFQSHWMSVNQFRYHYLDEGMPEDAPVVMVHGNPSWSYYYRNLIPEISKNHRVIVPDHMGMGLSDKPQDYIYRLEKHIENLEFLVESLNLKDITLVLHDWGGVIGMGYAVRHPEKVKQFVILNTAAFYMPILPLSLQLARSPFLGDFLVRGLNGFALSALFFGVVHHERMTKAIRQGFLSPYDNWHNRIAIFRFVQDIPAEENHPSRKLLDEIGEKIGIFKDHPMLIAWGDKDPVFSRKFFDEWNQRFPQAQSHLFQDAGHYVLEDAYERILPLILKFLNT
ncbi:MAG: alpha/beta fold hydrolase [Chloroflexota bacterium]